MSEPREVPVTLHHVSGDGGPTFSSGTIADTPENRAALEAAAIPRCREWREANPEARDCPVCNSFIMASEVQCTHCGTWNEPIAPYCCSAYCDRCNGLRALNGDDPALLPNEWMRHV